MSGDTSFLKEKKFKTNASYKEIVFMKIKYFLLLLVTSISVTAVPAHSQDTELTLEEILVTATKREKGLQDVPISIAVMSGERIEQQGITELEDLAVFMPNVHIAEGGAGTQLFIRGVGSGINPGFEQSVGTFIDGVYYGRGRSARAAFLDIERVEILKGPQSTFFGKNTVAGAINITTAKPTEDFDAYIETSYKTKLEGRSITAMTSGALTPNIRGRVVGKCYEDNGYVENKTPGGIDGPAQEDTLARVSLEWDLDDNILVSLKAESGSYNVDGRQNTMSDATPIASSLYQAYGDPNFRAGFNYKKYQKSFPDRPVYDDTDSDNYQITIDYQLKEFKLRSITSYNEYEFTNIADVDFSPLAFIDRGRTEEHQQFSQELLLTSPAGTTWEYLAGVYYQDNKLKNNRLTKLAISAIPPLEAAAGLMPGQGDVDFIANFKQDTSSYSAFTSLTWNISERFKVQMGLRYSDEAKDIKKSSQAVTPGTTTPNAFLAFLYSDAIPGTTLSLANTHNFALEREEDHWTGNLNFQYDINSDVMIYLNLANGYKGGGFDEDNALGKIEFAEFEDESVISIEAGAKLTLFENRAQANIALFHSEFEDVQVSTFDGNCCFNVGNAAESETRGIEADLELAVTHNILLSASIAYLDATYKSFSTAPCSEDQFLSTIANGGARSDCSQNLSGAPLQFAPEWSGNIGLTYSNNLTNQMELTLGTEINWSDEIIIAIDQDDHFIQDRFAKVNALATLNIINQWTISIIGKNLNKQKTFTWGNDVPLASLGFSKTYFRHINQPRTFEVRIRYSY
jgi:iron complex outermembrane recepter protein